MLQKLRSNRSVLSVGPMGTWTWTGPIGPRDQDGPDQSVLEIPLDRVEPILSVRLDSVQNRSVSVGLGPVQTEVVHTCHLPFCSLISKTIPSSTFHFMKSSSVTLNKGSTAR